MKRILDDLESIRLSSISHLARRQGFLLGRYTLRMLLAQQSGLDPSRVSLHVETSGKPVSPGSGLHLSLAHTDDRALAAVSRRIVGVDIERIRDKPLALLDYILHPEEREHILSLELGWPRTLFLCWTLKEALLKATGSGLRKAPRRVRLDLDVDRGRARVLDPEGGSWEGRFVEEGGFVSAIVFEN